MNADSAATVRCVIIRVTREAFSPARHCKTAKRTVMITLPTRVPITSGEDQGFRVPPHCIASVKLTSAPMPRTIPGISMTKMSSFRPIGTGLTVAGKWK